MLVHLQMKFASKSLSEQQTFLSLLFLFRKFTKKFDALFRLEEIYSSLKISPIYLKKINQWLHDDETLLEQIKKQVDLFLQNYI